MQTRIIRWLLGVAVALALLSGLAFGGSRPSVAHGAGPTPTPTLTTNSNDPGGGDGGGH
ncbi:MAG TPA: hypothetical protein VFT66_20345 [Roseiflexaceae bacterium]|jgi:hypothetical protein|nr:hypothetical protein [Roseiflexaceae bacterium]